MRIVRRILEEDLQLEEGSLEPQKKYISSAVDRVGLDCPSLQFTRSSYVQTEQCALICIFQLEDARSLT
jgi:hypothetical protein